MIVRFPNWFPQFGKRLSVLLVASSTGFKLLRAFPSRSHSQRCKIPDIHFPPSIFAPRCQNQNIFTFLVFDCICNWMDPFQSLSISGGRQEHVDLSQERGKIPCERNTAIFVIALGLWILSHQNFIAEGGEELQSCLEAKLHFYGAPVVVSPSHQTFAINAIYWLCFTTGFIWFLFFLSPFLSLLFVPKMSFVYQANGLYFGVRIFQIKEDLSRIHQANPSHLWTPRKDISLQISWRSKTLEKWQWIHWTQELGKKSWNWKKNWEGNFQHWMQSSRIRCQSLGFQDFRPLPISFTFFHRGKNWPN